ncbi:ComEA family DNA-binding protein [Streptomyces litchfieldiae]|uniref:ComEA family DNA-binding protein n=1 Tax=Streptomyces litchfieldiae TaxID=3075543 RepID=A0ABU2MWT8_9ACTN|nr:ComEA family DNA-binding protein [Streptomyces sp. DSM 44938]MDT0345308.1 ComEA family DNA-binding protein [Streptomyces sp. DSM 44938]
MSVTGWRVVPRLVEPGAGGAPPGEPAAEPGAGGGRRLPPLRRARLALAERLPAWARPRCGVEPRTLAALCLVLVVAAGFAVHHYWTGRPRAVPAAERASAEAEVPAAVPGAEPSPSASPSGAGGGATVVVDVAGDVVEPGIYTLPSGARVADAIEAAGGGEPGADTGGLNRARVLVDGEQIVVGGEPARAPVPGGPPGATAGPVSLNAATAEELGTLPGIGPVLAGHIVTYRTEHGPFTSIDQLGEVTGIGERRLADLRDRVTL